MGSVKPGYGPRDPEQQWKNAEGLGGPRGPRKANDKGLSVGPQQAREAVSTAQATSASLHAARASGEGLNDATAAHNAAMAKLGQVHPGLAQSMVAIHHLTGSLADANARGDAGKHVDTMKAQLRAANKNLVSRINTSAPHQPPSRAASQESRVHNNMEAIRAVNGVAAPTPKYVPKNRGKLNG